ncbi:MAG: DUF4249 domain-containing protein [Flavobacteriaceae bacterium]|nr:DUF4249 domain-containing protein [Flavobacteriaceae bacterium]
MKKLQLYFIILSTIILSSCEKVIDVDLNTMSPKLVIDASIKWQKGTVGNQQTIKLSTTTSYYNNQITTVSAATVFITDASNNVFNFVETAGTGNYICTNFAPVLNGNYVLMVVLNGETYTATETLKPVPIINSIAQIDNAGFSGKDIEIKTFYTDNGTTDDYYLFKFKPSFTAIPIYFLQEDRNFQGNQIFGLYRSEELKPGQTFGVTLSGISKQYYNYMQILVSIAGNSSGSPFQSPSATVRGNIINATSEANYPLGYFSLSEQDSRNYIVN